jgi:hypothetical protein
VCVCSERNENKKDVNLVCVIGRIIWEHRREVCEQVTGRNELRVEETAVEKGQRRRRSGGNLDKANRLDREPMKEASFSLSGSS